jgi:signal transduction histidine kinase/CheY-like chemotaxis protein
MYTYLSKIFAKAIVICLLAFCFNISIFALDPQKLITQYSHDIWQDELPQNSIQSIIQTHDGYMWFATYGGLVRFDGNRFTVFDPYNSELKSPLVLSLYEDSKERLWIGTGRGLTCLKDGVFTTYTTKDGLANNSIRSFFEDSEANLWIGTDRGISRFKDGKFYNHTTDNIAVPVRAIYQHFDGAIWIGTETSGLYKLNKDGNFVSYTVNELPLTKTGIFTIYRDKNNNVWFGTTEGLCGLTNTGRVVIYTIKNGLSSNVIESICEDKDGNLWAGSQEGLNRLKDEKISTFTSKEGLSQDSIRSLYEDKEGSFWVGTNGGLNRLKDGKFTNFTTKEGLANNNARTIYQDQKGNIWIGTDGGGVNCLTKEKAIINYTTKDGLCNNVVRTIYQDHLGTLWIGTANGISQLKDGKFTSYFIKDGLLSDVINAILEDKKGNIWIGTSSGGLSCFKDGKFFNYTIKEGLLGNTVRSLFEDIEGNLWIGTTNGLNFLKDNIISPSPFLKDVDNRLTVFSFYQDTAGNFWIGSDQGLYRIKEGKISNYTTKQGLFNDVVFQILEDSKNNLWMSCNKGIFQVSKKDLDDYDAGKISLINYISYGKADGMGTNQCNGATQPSAWKSREGNLWFATAKGVAKIDPQNIKLNTLVPLLKIEEVVVDGKAININQQIKLTPGTQKVDFHYTALSFLAPNKVKFKYKLVGYDKDWEMVDTRRTAYYTNIPPGTYQFRVIACNNDGIWNEEGAFIDFQVMISPWKTWGAYFFYVLGIVGLVSGGLIIRLNSLQRLNKVLETKVNIRTAELDKKNEELAKNLNQLNQTVEQLKISEENALEAKKKALEASQAKSTFLSNMSHELRTPLNAIIGFAQLMVRDKSLNQTQHEHLGIIVRSGQHLLNLINDVLSLAKIEAGKLTLNEQPFNLKQMLRNVEEMLQIRAKEKGLQLIFELSNIPSSVIGDEGKLRQVLINLLSNAVKFTEVGKIVLRANWENNVMNFEVEDTGLGMAEDEVNKSFEAFVQTNSSKKVKEGTGLGLAISKDFVKLMGGELKAKSKLGQGTTFYFSAKLRCSDIEVLPIEENFKITKLKAGQPNYKVLVVDDIAENRKLLVMLLEPLGFQLFEATNGEEAIEVWKKSSPDLIWMDIRMPVMDGQTATKIIRNLCIEQPTVKAPIIIALTASVFDHDRKAVLSAGCNDFVIKPLNEQTIINKLAEHLGAVFEEPDLSKDSIVISESSDSNEPVLTPARLAQFPTKLITDLAQAIDLGDNTTAFMLIDEIAQKDKALANELSNMVKNFQIDELLDLIGKVFA